MEELSLICINCYVRGCRTVLFSSSISLMSKFLYLQFPPRTCPLVSRRSWVTLPLGALATLMERCLCVRHPPVWCSSPRPLGFCLRVPWAINKAVTTTTLACPLPHSHNLPTKNQHPHSFTRTHQSLLSKHLRTKDEIRRKIRWVFSKEWTQVHKSCS